MVFDILFSILETDRGLCCNYGKISLTTTVVLIKCFSQVVNTLGVQRVVIKDLHSDSERDFPNPPSGWIGFCQFCFFGEVQRVSLRPPKCLRFSGRDIQYAWLWMGMKERQLRDAQGSSSYSSACELRASYFFSARILLWLPDENTF